MSDGLFLLSCRRQPGVHAGRGIKLPFPGKMVPVPSACTVRLPALLREGSVVSWEHSTSKKREPDGVVALKVSVELLLCDCSLCTDSGSGTAVLRGCRGARESAGDAGVPEYTDGSGMLI